MDFTYISSDILFTIAGSVFVCGEGHIYLSEWRNAPQEERDKIKIIPLYHNIGGVIVLSDITLLMKELWSKFPSHWFVCAMIAWLIVAGFDVWYIEKNNRYHRL